MEKPWNNINKNDHVWFRSSNHRYGNFKTLSNIDAIIIVQDCNMAGEYFRVISWINNDHYFNTMSHRDWSFDIKLDKMVLNSVVTELANNKKFKVTHSDMYYKILEKIEK